MAKIKNGAADDIFNFYVEHSDHPAYAGTPPIEKPKAPELVRLEPQGNTLREKLKFLIHNTPGGLSYPQAADILGVPEEAFRVTAHDMLLNMEIRDTGKRWKDAQGYQRVVWTGPLQSEAA